MGQNIDRQSIVGLKVRISAKQYAPYYNLELSVIKTFKWRS